MFPDIFLTAAKFSQIYRFLRQVSTLLTTFVDGTRSSKWVGKRRE